MVHRREFLKSVGAGALIGAAVPAHSPAAWFTPIERPRHLVIIELTGGNDGLNTVIPFTDPAYRRERTKLAIAESAVVKLDEALGFHPRLAPLEESFREGELAILQGVGYPDPDRSHFRSLDVWHAGNLTGRDDAGGWIARALARLGPAHADHDLFHLGQGAMPGCFRGAPVTVTSLDHPQDLRLTPGVHRQAMEGPDSTGDEILRFLEEGAKQAVTLEKRIASALSKPSGIDYPRSPFGRHLEIIARLVATSDRGAVHFVQLTGFDTHAGQPESHPILLGVFAAAVAALIRDLKASRCFSNTALFVYSEFGRRVRENASLGTDHGKAGPAFVLGGGVDGGLKGAPPDLDDLDEGDLKHTIDLRAIQAELAEGFLGFPAADDAVGRSGPALFKRR